MGSLNRLSRFWSKGYLYMAVAAAMYSAYALTDRIGIYDWQKEVPYFNYIHISLRTFHTLPYFWWNKLANISRYPAIAQTSNFIANPETFLFSPFTPMLVVLEAVSYLKFLLLAHCLIGLAGLLALRRRLRWNDLQFRTYAILFLFVPVIIQHVSIGFTPWMNLFFFPWLMYFVAEDDHVIGTLGISGVLAWVLLQGGVHPFVWLGSIVALYFLSSAVMQRRWDAIWRLLCAGALTVPLCAARLYATMQAYGGFSQPFERGYNPATFLFLAIVPPVLVAPYDTFFLNRVWAGLPSWDGGMFWGAALPMLAVLLVKYRRYRTPRGVERPTARVPLDLDAVFLASSVLFCFSFFSLLQATVESVNRVAHVPFLQGVEKYPFRLVIPALLGYSLLIAHYAQDIWEDVWAFIEQRRPSARGMLKVVEYGAASAAVLCVLALIASMTRFNGPTTFAWYLKWSHSSYLRMQASLAVAAVFLAVTTPIARNRGKWLVGVQGTPYGDLEVLLAVPLVCATAMWFWLGMAAAHDEYPSQGVWAPRVVARSAGLSGERADIPQPRLLATPRQLVIRPSGPMPERYVLPEVLFTDARFLEVTSHNATLANLDGTLSIVPQSQEPIVVDFKSARYVDALVLTAVAWLLAVGAFAWRWATRRARRRAGACIM